MGQTISKVFVMAICAVLLTTFVIADSVTLRPDGAGHRKGWGHVGCSGGSSEWQCVDEASADTSDYLRTTGTAKETFTFSDSGLSTEIIQSVTLFYYAMEHNNNKNRCFDAMTRSGGTDYESGTQLCVGTSWELVSHTFATNPATGNAWTVSEVDALEAGMRGTNPDGGGRVAQVYAEVAFNATCGNNITEIGEVCDGSDLDSQTCSTQGFDGGTLSCASDCQSFVTTSCWDDTCSDTDGGYSPLVQGTTSGDLSGSPYINTDVCLDAVLLTEYFCIGNQESSAVVNCSGNSTTSCSAGACV